MKLPTLTVLDDAGDEQEVPCKFEACPRCEGTGSHDHPAFCNGLSSQDFEEDPDFREQYFRGEYDVRCTTCGGERVVPVVDAERLTPDQARWVEARARAAAEDRAERRMAERGIEW